LCNEVSGHGRRGLHYGRVERRKDIQKVGKKVLEQSNVTPEFVVKEKRGKKMKVGKFRGFRVLGFGEEVRLGHRTNRGEGADGKYEVEQPKKRGRTHLKDSLRGLHCQEVSWGEVKGSGEIRNL